MPRSRRSAVQAYHDRVAPRYDHSYDDAYWQWHDALTWDYLKPHLPRDLSAQIVDLGCGTGKWAGKLVKSGYAVTCVDISHRMLDQARDRIGHQGASARAAFVQADLCDLSALPAGRFELAIALGDPLGCTESPARALKQIRRILREGGTLIATFDNRLAGIEYYLASGDAQALARFLRDGKTHWLTKEREERFPITMLAPADVIRLVESAGFAVLDLRGKTVLPMRHCRQLLETPEARRRWAKLEKTLCRDPYALGRASHLQITCRNDTGR
jgi:ubiquinone/menaquinone biosynthesis C-methylase UbiE